MLADCVLPRIGKLLLQVQQVLLNIGDCALHLQRQGVFVQTALPLRHASGSSAEAGWGGRYCDRVLVRSVIRTPPLHGGRI